jgi:glutathione peroxidase
MTYDHTLEALDGGTLDLSSFRGRPTLIVNVASKCGLTPQYEGLQSLYERYADRGLNIVGVPCNQFGEQEPGSPEEIATFCSANYGVTFPLTTKLDVNGPNRHPLYEELTATPDAEGKAGDVQWNFEKFLSLGGRTFLPPLFLLPGVVQCLLLCLRLLRHFNNFPLLIPDRRKQQAASLKVLAGPLFRAAYLQACPAVTLSLPKGYSS